MLKRFLVLFWLTVLHSPSLFADQLVSCNDGDTCRIKASDKDGTVRRVRLSGIDAPESGQLHWKESRDFLVNLMKDQELELQCKGNSFNRATCRIFIKSLEVNEEMVKKGMAWNYPQFSGKLYSKAEQDARENRLGLWKQNPKSSPFCFRHVRSGECRSSNNLYQP